MGKDWDDVRKNIRQNGISIDMLVDVLEEQEGQIQTLVNLTTQLAKNVADLQQGIAQVYAALQKITP